MAEAAVETLPTPPELATPTDLSEKDARAAVEAVNPLIADAFALYAKTKNFHWRLSGSHFRDHHKLLDDQAGEVLETIDPTAEQVRKIGGTICGASYASSLQSIEDDNDEFVHPGGMEDNRHIARKARSAHEVSDECRDYSTSDLLEVVPDGAKNRTWYLHENPRQREHRLSAKQADARSPQPGDEVA